jgi:hypothetical protein
MINRERKLDINTLKPEEVDVISKQIGEKIKEICDKACADANKFLNVYSMTAKMQVLIEHPDLKKEVADALQPKRKRGRPRKATQSLT